ncbi:MAG: hypothetical protein KC910_10605, partial [Candidatus Eremiobacteraeota bacterium]|nr:hypothetical protein [Candidatus Eremiobacteraeota bacterium]
MFFLLALPWLLGSLLANRVLKLDDPLACLSLGWAAGWLYAAMGVNFGLLAGLSLTSALWMVLALCLAGSLALALKPGPGWKKPAYSPMTWVYLAVGAAAIHFTTNTILYLNPDDDFFLHAPLQAHLLKGTFPIVNPFFTNIAYGGHYARDLVTVMAARLTGLTLYGVQVPVTVTMQLAAFLVLFSGLYRQTGSQLQAGLGTTFVFAGANAGFRGGWIDTVANNNALAQMVFALCFFLVLEALFGEAGWGVTAMAGVALGGSAWAYETNFALTCLGLCGLALSTFCLKSLTRRQLVTALAIVAITLPLGLVQGGVFKNLLAKLRGGGSLTTTEADATLQSQNLEVSVKFPKERLFQIKLERSGEEMSMAYSTLPWLRNLPKHSGQPGYVSVFSWYAVRIHWLGLYLAPISLWLLGRRRNWSGLLLWWVGFAGYFLPSVVDFGLWEAEVFRWEFVASWGFSGALGVALAHWWLELPGPVATFSKGQIQLPRKGLAAALVGLVVVANTYPALQQMHKRTGQLDSLASGLFFHSAAHWVERQPELNLYPADFAVARWLDPRMGEGDRLLTNPRDENYFNVYFEAAFAGLCGAHPVGHTFPLPFERLGTWPFRQKAAARAFWASRDLALLGNLTPDWIYLRGGEPLPLEPAFELGQRILYRVSVEPLKPGPPAELAVEEWQLPHHLEVEQYHRLGLRLTNPTPAPLELETTFSYALLDAEGKPAEPCERFYQPISLALPPGGQQSLELHFVAPHQQGNYRVQGWLGSQALSSQLEIEVGNRQAVESLELLSAQPLDPLTPGQVAR